MYNSFLQQRSRIFYIIFVFVCLAVCALLVWVYRADLSLYAWNTLRVAPEYAASQNPENAQLSMDIADYYFNVYDEGAYDINKAEEYYMRALHNESDIPRAWYQLARISFIKGQFATALYRVNKQFELHGEAVPQGYYVRGLIYGFNGQHQKAADDLAYYLANWYPKSWHTHTDLAWAYFMQDDFDKSAEIAKRGLAFHPDNPWLLTMYGVSLVNLDETEAARAPLERAHREAQRLTTADWARAYPGNDPSIRSESLAFMKDTIRQNLELVAGD